MCRGNYMEPAWRDVEYAPREIKRQDERDYGVIEDVRTEWQPAMRRSTWSSTTIRRVTILCNQYTGRILFVDILQSRGAKFALVHEYKWTSMLSAVAKFARTLTFVNSVMDIWRRLSIRNVTSVVACFGSSLQQRCVRLSILSTIRRIQMRDLWWRESRLKTLGTKSWLQNG